MVKPLNLQVSGFCWCNQMSALCRTLGVIKPQSWKLSRSLSRGDFSDRVVKEILPAHPTARQPVADSALTSKYKKFSWAAQQVSLRSEEKLCMCEGGFSMCQKVLVPGVPGKLASLLWFVL